MKKRFEIEWEGDKGAVCEMVLRELIAEEYETGRRLQWVKVTQLPEQESKPKKKLEKLNIEPFFKDVAPQISPITVAEKVNELIDRVNEL